MLGEADRRLGGNCKERMEEKLQLGSKINKKLIN